MLRNVAVLVLAGAATLGAQTARVTLKPASTITVEGTSNVHDWHLATSTFVSEIEMASPANAGSEVRAVTLSIPVTSLKSGKGGLDKNTYKALNAEKHPDITFRLTSYKTVPSASGHSAIVKGMLKVNGVEKEVALNTSLSGDAASGLTAVGATKFLMTDFGVKPVTALMGAIRTGNAITIKFSLAGTVAQQVAMLARE